MYMILFLEFLLTLLMVHTKIAPEYLSLYKLFENGISFQIQLR
jgi:hypothetical protein